MEDLDKEIEKILTEEQQDETAEAKKPKRKKPSEIIKDLEEEIKILKEEKLLIKADSENYRKRINEEKIRDRKYASTNLIHDLLLPLDQLKKVVEYEVDSPELKNYLMGFKMISNNIYQVLEEDGLKEIKALNEKFDPNFHYAVEKENNKDVESGIITEVIVTGYMYKDRLLRAAQVKVNEWSEEENE